jgi:hypothetical protein
MDGFRGFYKLMFRIVMCQIRKCYASAEIQLVDVEMLSFDLFPRTVFAGEVFDKANWNLVLHSLTVGLPNRTKEQHPSLTLTALFLL